MQFTWRRSTSPLPASFNLASGNGIPLRHIIETARNLIDLSLPLDFGAQPYRHDQVMHLEGNVSKLKLAAQWTPHVDIETGLHKTIEWHKRIRRGRTSKNMSENLDDTKSFALTLRKHAIRMIAAAKASHLGSCLSIADLLANIYGGFLRIDPKSPKWRKRDFFFLSKGHAAAILYAALAEKGFFSIDELQQYCKEGSRLTGHATTGVPGVELSTGSLGHALPVACGVALASKREETKNRAVVILSDGELDEGSNWEAILFAAHHGLDNLIAIVDYNKIQSFGSVEQVMNLEPLAAKWRSFGWSVQEIDGHDHGQIADALGSLPFSAGMPSVIIAHTVKGKGVSFMEDKLAWHYKSPTAEQVEAALHELEGVA